MFNVKVVALKAHPYGGKRRQKGAKYFITNPVHSKLLISIKAVRLLPSLTEESEKKDMTIKKKVRKKSSYPRTYARKDLVAEDSIKTKRKIKKDSVRARTSLISQECNSDTKAENSN